MENESYIHFVQPPDNAEDILREAAYGEPYGEAREEWGQRLLRALDLPDERLNKRCLKILMTLAKKPIDSLNQACQGWSDAKAAYRFVENDRVSPEDLQNPITKAAALETTGQKVVIAVQDTTAISFDSARRAEGLGTVNDSEKARGMFYHPVLLLREDGLALGLLDQQAWCRESQVEGKAKDRRNRPIMEKESAKWLRGVAGANLALKTNLQESERPKIIHVMDREGDVHEVFQIVETIGDGAVIRSAHNRSAEAASGEKGYVHDLVAKTAPLGETVINVPRKRGQKARNVTMEVRSLLVTLNPKKERHTDRRPIALTLVELREMAPPKGLEPLLWLLWTNEPASELGDALRVIDIYCLRWRIEDFFRVLKGGCRIEDLQFETAQRLEKMVSLYAPVALRILQCRDLARLNPKAPCTVALSPNEWKTLWIYIHRSMPHPAQEPPSIEQATLWVGRLGGHLNRKSDGMPGVITLWRGFRDLSLLTEMYILTRQ